MLSEPREASGLTTRLVLTFVEREGGRAAVDEVLSRCGLSDREDELRDENAWFPDHTRTDLFEAAAATLGDPDVARRIGSAAIGLNVGQAPRARCGLGSQLIYSNIGQTQPFNRVHPWTSSDAVRPRRADPQRPDRRRGPPPDCGYNLGLLSCVPLVFGEPKRRASATTLSALPGVPSASGRVECAGPVGRDGRHRRGAGDPHGGRDRTSRVASVATTIAERRDRGVRGQVIADHRRLVLQNQLSRRVRRPTMAKSMQDLVSRCSSTGVLSKVLHRALSRRWAAPSSRCWSSPRQAPPCSRSSMPLPRSRCSRRGGARTRPLLAIH